PRNITLVVTEWRLPRVLMALLIGAALGVSGALFQPLMRNLLGSPDVFGFNSGAWSGVLVAMFLFGQQLTAIALAAMSGGVVTSSIGWLLALRARIATFRLILTVSGIPARLFPFNSRRCSQASLETVAPAAVLTAGSVNVLP
ncbi:iron chelate uptake ABC transporter family permease subunit, partial [Salmonella enterica]|uniref:iron chelate uptake ABC transporter family permease subunit n=1 Tax=Salmonella enterica TaxID=28901 RepID=UPI00398C5CF0